MRHYGTVVCGVCGTEAAKTGPRQVTCGRDECRAELAARARAKTSPTAAAPGGNPVAGALADVVLFSRGRSHRRGLRTFMADVKLLNDAVRSKDPDAYRGVLLRIATWTLRELAHVRPTGDSSGH